jgi:hypothetical protein
LPFEEWHPKRISQFCSHLLLVLDNCHDRHCEYELYTASSNLLSE